MSSLRVKISYPVLLFKYFTISKCLESSVRLCGRGGGDSLIQFDRHKWAAN